jgi:hypothetical protein
MTLSGFSMTLIKLLVDIAEKTITGHGKVS